MDEITHVVSTTCTNSANPGFDHYVTKQLGLRSGVEKILLHGIGCSGGLAAIRVASNLALGSSFRKKPARALVLACEISSVLVRSELDSIDKEQKTRIGVCLFSDCASAAILSNGVGEDDIQTPKYEILGWRHEILEDTDKDLGFDVDPLGIYSLHQRHANGGRFSDQLTFDRLEGRADTSSSINGLRCSVTGLPRHDQVATKTTQGRQASNCCGLRLGSAPWRLYYYHWGGASDESHPRSSEGKL